MPETYLQLQDRTQATLGMRILPYGDAWPDLRDILSDIYGKIGAVPWFPPQWLAQVNALHGKNSMLLIPTPSSARNPPAISFIKTPEQAAWWNEFERRANAALMLYAEKQASEGRKVMAAANADAAFWDSAYRVAVFLATPVTVARSAFNNPYTTLLLAGAALFIFFRLKK